MLAHNVPLFYCKVDVHILISSIGTCESKESRKARQIVLMFRADGKTRLDVGRFFFNGFEEGTPRPPTKKGVGKRENRTVSLSKRG